MPTYGGFNSRVKVADQYYMKFCSWAVDITAQEEDVTVAFEGTVAPHYNLVKEWTTQLSTVRVAFEGFWDSTLEPFDSATTDFRVGHTVKVDIWPAAHVVGQSDGYFVDDHFRHWTFPQLLLTRVEHKATARGVIMLSLTGLAQGQIKYPDPSDGTPTPL